MKKRNSQFAAFIGKEFKHILRDRQTVLIALILPIMQIILFGFAISTEVNNVRFALLDPSKDNTTRQIAERFRGNGYFTQTAEIHSPQEIDAIFKQDKADMVLVFGDNFDYDLAHTGHAQIQILADGIDPNLARIASNYAAGIISAFQGQPEGAVVVPNIKMLYNPQLKSSYNFVPGVMGLIITLICAMMTAVSIVREKERGTMEIMLVSPMKPIFMIVAKMVPYLAISAVSMTLVVLLAVTVLGVPLAGGVMTLVLVSTLFIIVSLSLGLLISTLVSSQVAAMMISGMVLMMPVALLSGMLFPVESMPKVFQWFSAALPARWYIASVRKVMIEGLGMQYVWRESLILFSMALLLIGISLKNFKNRLA